MDVILNCLGACVGRNREKYLDKERYADDEHLAESGALASDILTVLFNTENADKDMNAELKKIVGTHGWTENLAVAILSGIIKAISNDTPMGKAAMDALERSMKEAVEWAKDHPEFVLCTIIALGILVIMAPWIIEALGFSARGVVAQTFAAWWQAQYRGYVPKGSLFSFFQRLGMNWKR